MSNIADMIEDYILQQLATKDDGKVELRRTDIADEISCAPSQISYVLNTRFTQDKGFMVESRRGLGGFIRIVQVPLNKLIYQEMADSITANTTYDEIKGMVNYLIKREMISSRESAMLAQVINAMFNSSTMETGEKIKLLKSLFLTLDKFS